MEDEHWANISPEGKEDFSLKEFFE